MVVIVLPMLIARVQTFVSTLLGLVAAIVDHGRSGLAGNAVAAKKYAGAVQYLHI